MKQNLKRIHYFLLLHMCVLGFGGRLGVFLCFVSVCVSLLTHRRRGGREVVEAGGPSLPTSFPSHGLKLVFAEHLQPSPHCWHLLTTSVPLCRSYLNTSIGSSEQSPANSNSKIVRVCSLEPVSEKMVVYLCILLGIIDGWNNADKKI